MTIECAGIVTFNPEIKRLESNLQEICKQVDNVLIVDNGSINIDEVDDIASSYKQVNIIKLGENKGIAYALNMICDYFYKDFENVMLLDQDSIIANNLVEEFEKHIRVSNVALLSPYVIDINKMSIEEYTRLKLPETTLINYAITSGSVIDLSVWKKMNGFDNDLFIDAVDIDYSIRLQINGYQQIRVNSTYLLQEVGRAEKTKIMRVHIDNSGKWSLSNYYRSNHSLTRQYYMTRNNIILAKKYKKYRSQIKQYLFTIVYSLPKILVEKNKVKLIKTIYNGFIDGIFYKIQPYQKDNIK